MSLKFNINTNNHDEWLTPPKIIESLGKFDLDPCSPIKRPWDTAKYHYNKIDDGLKKQWFGRVWCNPPYGKETFKWLEKLADHKNGIGLIFARTETKGFQKQVFERAEGVFFFAGRIIFLTVDGIKKDRPSAPSCLVIYGKDNLKAVEKSQLKGKLIYL